MNTATQSILFSKGTDTWGTPQDLFDRLDSEFHFVVDVAADEQNHKCPVWFGPGGEVEDALAVQWCASPCWMNPPYSAVREFIAKAAAEAKYGVTTVALIPSRTDTRWWHEYIWDVATHDWRPGVQGRFLKGRLKFVRAGGGLLRGTTMNGSNDAAPFPSVVVVFYGQ